MKMQTVYIYDANNELLYVFSKANLNMDIVGDKEVFQKSFESMKEKIKFMLSMLSDFEKNGYKLYNHEVTSGHNCYGDYDISSYQFKK